MSETYPPPRPISIDVLAEKQSRVDAFIQKYKRVEQPDHRGQSRSDTVPDHMRGGCGIDYRNKHNGRSEQNRFKLTVSKQQLDRELEQFGAKRNEKK
jgi:hypothetical protein